MGVSTPAKGEDCLRRVAFSLSSVIRAAMAGHGLRRICRHSANHAGGESPECAVQRSRLRLGIFRRSGSRSIFSAAMTCMARLRASARDGESRFAIPDPSLTRRRPASGRKPSAELSFGACAAPQIGRCRLAVGPGPWFLTKAFAPNYRNALR